MSVLHDLFEIAFEFAEALLEFLLFDLYDLFEDSAPLAPADRQEEVDRARLVGDWLDSLSRDELLTHINDCWEL